MRMMFSSDMVLPHSVHWAQLLRREALLEPPPALDEEVRRLASLEMRLHALDDVDGEGQPGDPRLAPRLVCKIETSVSTRRGARCSGEPYLEKDL
jgi:hypothetical protein